MNSEEEYSSRLYALMVMHARKLPRINDGYYDRHQQGHSSYQNSKYGSSKSSSSYPDRYNQDRSERSERSRNSPNGNTSRSNTPERDHSPRNRSYSNKTWYLQKLHEKERDRSYRNEQGRDRPNNKDKYYPSDHSRSPKDRRPVNKESGHSTDHDRNNDRNSDRSNTDKPNNVSKSSGQNYNSSKDSQRKPTHSSSRDKRVGDWSEHTSSSGKKYFYNWKTEVSQWEKPREWLEKEGLTHLLRSSGSSSSSSSRQMQDKHSSSRSNSIANNYRDHHKYSHGRESSSSGWNHRDGVSHEHYVDHRHESSLNASGAIIGEAQAQDMEISSENSTPTSENYAAIMVSQQRQLMDIHIPHNSSTGPGPPENALESSMQPCSTPKLLHSAARSEIKQEPMPSSISYNSALAPIAIPSTIGNDRLADTNATANQSKLDPNNICDTGGPPTPTHSETQDDIEQKSGGSPETTTPGVSALQGIQQLQGFYPMQLPQLTPGLSQFVNDDLTEHVRGWPAEACERQAHKLATEAHLVTSMKIMDISIALKSARSRVRLNEIQSTLLEQRVMLYRHEVKSLESMKTPSLFTSDDNN